MHRMQAFRRSILNTAAGCRGVKVAHARGARSLRRVLVGRAAPRAPRHLVQRGGLTAWRLKLLKSGMRGYPESLKRFEETAGRQGGALLRHLIMDSLLLCGTPTV